MPARHPDTRKLDLALSSCFGLQLQEHLLARTPATLLPSAGRDEPPRLTQCVCVLLVVRTNYTVSSTVSSTVCAPSPRAGGVLPPPMSRGRGGRGDDGPSRPGGASAPGGCRRSRCKPPSQGTRCGSNTGLAGSATRAKRRRRVSTRGSGQPAKRAASGSRRMGNEDTVADGTDCGDREKRRIEVNIPSRPPRLLATRRVSHATDRRCHLQTPQLRIHYVAVDHESTRAEEESLA